MWGGGEGGEGKVRKVWRGGKAHWVGKSSKKEECLRPTESRCIRPVKVERGKIHISEENFSHQRGRCKVFSQKEGRGNRRQERNKKKIPGGKCLKLEEQTICP